MAYEIMRMDEDDISLRISGVMKLLEQQSLQNVGAELIAQGKKLRMLVTLEGFEGWEKGVDWGDVGFLMTYGDDIARIAVVGEERWKDQIYAFLGKGLRTTEIEFFPPSLAKEAEEWLRQ